MAYKLFLDDFRDPSDCIQYMYTKLGKKNAIYMESGWIIARNIDQFKEAIVTLGIPAFVSIDHDLEVEHYTWQTMYFDYDKIQRTGWHCVQFLIEMCSVLKQSFPEYAIHSQNKIGTENIQKLITETYTLNED